MQSFRIAPSDFEDKTMPVNSRNESGAVKWNGEMGRRPPRQAGWIEWVPALEQMELSERRQLWETKLPEALQHMEELKKCGRDFKTLAEQVKITGPAISRFRSQPDPSKWIHWAIACYVLSKPLNTNLDVGLRPSCDAMTEIDELNYLRVSMLCDDAEVNFRVSADEINGHFEQLRWAEHLLEGVSHIYYTRTAHNYLRALLSFVDKEFIACELVEANRPRLAVMVDRVHAIAQRSEDRSQDSDEVASKPMIRLLAGCIFIFADILYDRRRFAQSGVVEYIARGIPMPIKHENRSIRYLYYRNVARATEFALSNDRGSEANDILQEMENAALEDFSVVQDLAKVFRDPFDSTRKRIQMKFPELQRLLRQAGMNAFLIAAIMFCCGETLAGDGVKTIFHADGHCNMQIPPVSGDCNLVHPRHCFAGLKTSKVL
jgi:hypothetical protein